MTNEVGSPTLSQGKRLVILSGVSLALLAGIGLFAILDQTSIDFGSDSSSKEDKLPGVGGSVGLTSTDLQSFLESYGAWLTTEQSIALQEANGVRNLAFLRDNGLMYSTKSIAFDGKKPWTKTNTSLQISGVDAVGSRMEIKTSVGNTYLLNVTQPFVVEDNWNTVYVFDKNEQLWSAKIEELSFVDALSVADPKLGVNPELSISIAN